MTTEVAVRCRCGAVRCVRLGPKGMYRWYAECCNTPMGNTIPAIPFVGLARGAFEVAPEREDETFGRKSIVNIDSAVATPFFDRGKPTITPRVLTDEEREALRQHPRQ